jgi:transposase InsO family protein/uncharacterized membrane protein YgcG
MSRSSASPASSSPSLGGSLGSLPASVRFDGTPATFPLWKFNMMTLLRMHKLHDVVLQPHPRKRAAAAAAAAAGASSAAVGSASAMAAADDGAAAAAAAEVQSASDQLWEERADRAFGMLVLCFTSPTLTSLARQVDAGDAHAVWMLLVNRYERKTDATQVATNKSLLSARMEEGEAVDAYVARLKTLVTLLADMGEPVGQGLQKHILLEGLPASFATLVGMLRWQQGKMTLDEIVTHLVDHQESLHRAEASSGHATERHEEVASYAQAAGAGAPWQQVQHRGGRGGNRFGGQGGGAGRAQSSVPFHGGGAGGGGGGGSSADGRACFTCDQVGHLSFDCPENRNAKKCFTCRRLGHNANQCPGSRRRQGGGAPPQQQRQQPAMQQQYSRPQQAAMAAVESPQYDEHDGDAVFMADASVAVCAAAITPPPQQEAASSSQSPAIGGSAPRIVEWVLDSAATRHLVCDESLLVPGSKQTLAESQAIPLLVADGARLMVREVGTCKLRTTVRVREAGTPGAILDSAPFVTEQRCVTLQGVACDSRLWCNLISVSRITKAGYSVSFGDTQAVVKHKVSGRIVLVVPRRGGLYVLQTPAHTDAERGQTTDAVFTAVVQAPQAVPAIVVQQPAVGVAVARRVVAVPLQSMSQASVQQLPADRLWHYRLGHLSMGGLRSLSQGGALLGLPSKLGVAASASAGGALAPPTCEGCALGKAHRANFSRQRDPSDLATVPLQCVHADVCGPVVVRLQETQQQTVRASLDGSHALYLATITDGCTSRCWGAVVNTKGGASAHVRTWLPRVEKQSGRRVQEFHTDGGKEYLSLKDFFRERGILHSLTQPYTPQHNGVAERMNRTLFEMVRAMLQHARLPPAFWEEAILAAIYTRNRCLTSRAVHPERAAAAARLQTPEEQFTGVKPSASRMRVFGSDCFLHTPDEHRQSKLDAKSHRAIFVGYAANGGWRVLDLSSGKVVSSRDVIFNENQFTFRGDELARALGVAAAYEPIAEEDLDAVLGGMQLDEQAQIDLVTMISREEEEQRVRNAQAAAQAVAPPAAPAAVVAPSRSTGRRAPRGRSAALGVPIVPAAAAAPNIQAQPPQQQHAEPAAVGVAPVAAEEAGNARPQRVRMAPDRLTLAFVAADRAVDAHVPPSSVTAATSDPVDYTDAMQRPDAALWKAAMDAEMQSHARNGTWAIVEKPLHRRPIDNKWVLKTKHLADGSVDKLKARLVAKGFTQQYGVDYLNTWSPAVRYKTLRLVLALATRWDMELQQLDVETAFLNAKMKEEVYMTLPEGYERQLAQEASAAVGVQQQDASARPRFPAGTPLVCKLIMCLYGTKQASMEWNQEVNGTLVVKLGFKRSVCDPCLYYRVSRSGRLILLCLFVDDLVAAYHACDANEWQQLKSLFMSTYRCKDGGAIYSLLGMRLLRDRARRVLSIDQTVYVQQLLEQTQMADCKPIDTPAQPGVPLSSSDVAAPQSSSIAVAPLHWSRHKEYESGVGTISYAAASTRPDLSYGVNQLARFLQAPGDAHFTALKRMIRYLQGTKHLALVFDCSGTSQTNPNSSHCASPPPSSCPAPRRPLQPECVVVSAYCDADWGGCVDSRRSTTGFLVSVFGCAVSWMSKRQKSVALSSTEAEYMALAAVVAELQWVHQLLAEIGLRGTAEEDDGDDAPTADSTRMLPTIPSSSTSSHAAHASAPSSSPSPWCPGCETEVRSDNQSAISQVRGDSDYHARSKHIDIRYHFVKSAVRRGGMQLRWVQSAEQQADVFTKPLDAPTFIRLRDAIMGTQQTQQQGAQKTLGDDGRRRRSAGGDRSSVHEESAMYACAARTHVELHGDSDLRVRGAASSSSSSSQHDGRRHDGAELRLEYLDDVVTMVRTPERSNVDQPSAPASASRGWIGNRDVDAGVNHRGQQRADPNHTARGDVGVPLHPSGQLKGDRDSTPSLTTLLMPPVRVAIDFLPPVVLSIHPPDRTYVTSHQACEGIGWPTQRYGHLGMGDRRVATQSTGVSEE